MKKPKRAEQTKGGSAGRKRPAAKQRKHASRKKVAPKVSKSLSNLSKGGGNATASGVTFQASVGAIFATQLLAERIIDPRLGLGAVRVKSLRFESEAPIDDIAIETDGGGWVLIQAKNTLSLSADLDGELGKAIEQIVRQFIVSSSGSGQLGWDRPLNVSKDRFVIAVGPGSSASLTNDLAKALVAKRASHSVPLPIKQKDALSGIEKLVKAAWRRTTGSQPRSQDIQKILPLIAVLRFDVLGPDRAMAVEMMAHVTEKQAGAAGAFLALERSCQDLMSARQGADTAAFRRMLAVAGAILKAPPSYVDDVGKLRTYSAGVTTALKDFETVQIDSKRISVPRKSADAVANAAKVGSLLIIGEPGAGKSAVVNKAAAILRSAHHDVIGLAVDRLQVGTAEGLQTALGLTHPLVAVLENWPGVKPAFIFIDALDATRGGQGEAVFRTLIADILAMPSKRWRVVASIRSFDLRLGEQFRELFAGAPADATFFDGSFSDVRHVNIPKWSNEELAALLAQAPSLGAAIMSGGEKLRDLALVPFNTRLLADLISGGTSADAFGGVASQVELLFLYWRKRVTGLGAGAEVCLRAVVAEMVKGRTLQASKMTAAVADAAALNALLHQNVIVPVLRDRYVAFRHHILFDYAASRVFIDPINLSATGQLLRGERDLALMLAPALSYALQEIWIDGSAGHPEFWVAATSFAGELKSDPIARSVASRMACELPQTEADVAGFVALFGKISDREEASKALLNFAGALQVRADDKELIAAEPWCAVAGAIIPHIESVAWPLRNLLNLLVSRASTPREREQVGSAARALLTFSLSAGAGTAARLIRNGIEFVADTYGTNLVASRNLLSRLLASDRIAEYAHEDMPVLARQAKALLSVDPEFVVTIYRTIFGHKVTDTSATSLGGSQILPLTSNKKQDFDHSKWQLKEVVPGFLQTDPENGLRAVNAALEAFVDVEHKSDAIEQTIVIDGQSVTLREDMSHVWAHDPDDRHAHTENIASIIGAFRKYLETTDGDAAKKFAVFAVNHVKLAVLWARMLLVTAQRPDLLGQIMWPYASARPFLLSADTRKFAIDAVAAIYPQLDAPVREAFESGIADVEFPDVENPERTKQRFLAILFEAIGEPRLATQASKAILNDAKAAQLSLENRRPFQIFSSTSAAEPYWFLERKGVDLDKPENKALLSLAEALPERAAQQGKPAASIQDDADTLKALAEALRNGGSASPNVVEHAEDRLLDACNNLAWRKEELRASPEALRVLIDLVSRYLGHARPSAGATLAAGPRSVAVAGALRLCAVDQATADLLLPQLEKSLDDPAAGVRCELAGGFSNLWEYRRDDVWKISDHIVAHETNSDVLRAFVGFLCRAVHYESAKVEELVIALIPRAHTEENAHGDRIIEAIGNLIAVLWLRYERPKSRALLDAWLNDPVAHRPELGRAVSSLRDVVVGGYKSASKEDLQLQKNAQQFAAEVVERTAAVLDAYLAIPAASRTDRDNDLAGAAVRLLDNVGDQLYFSTGAFRADEKAEETGLVGLRSKLAFLNDTFHILRRIGDAGTPHTIFYLIDLLDYLMPADPPRVFDLVANALLNGGRKWGYEFESLGADRFVKVIGTFLADHRQIFSDQTRRAKLVECLDAFVEAGWPAARRLLYRLPELL